MANLFIENKDIILKVSPMETLFARYIRGGRFSNSAWKYPFSIDKVEEIQKSFPNIAIPPELKALISEEQSKLVQLLHLKKLKNATLEDIPIKTTLYNAQKVAVNYLLADDALMNASQQGTGKCVMSLSAIIKRKQRGEVRKCLIICPASVKGTWAREIGKHTYENSVIIQGKESQRLKMYKEYNDNKEPLFAITNYALLRRDVNKMGIDLDAVIVDESVKIKNPKTIQCKAVKALRTKYRIALSGYPADNKIEDIWSQFDWIKPGLLGSKWNFEDKYLVKQVMPFSSKSGKKINMVTGYKNLDGLRKTIDPYFIRFLRSDVVELPPKIYELREVDLGKEQSTQYKQMKDDMILKLSQMNEKDIVVQARDILSQLIRLSQICDGYISGKGLDAPVWLKENAKFAELDDIVEETVANNNKMIIWSRYVPVTERLYDRYKKYNPAMITGKVPTDKRDEEVQKFQNDDSCKIFLGQIIAAGQGLTLTAGNIQVFVDRGFLSPSSIAQAEDRQCRIGQTKTVLVISLIAKGTVDERWERLLKKKEETASILFKTPEKVFRNKGDIMEFLK